jgi:hypothetical protein
MLLESIFPSLWPFPSQSSWTLHTLGTDASKVDASVAIVSFRGFVPSEQPWIKVEARAQRILAYFTFMQDLLQLKKCSKVRGAAGPR